jgi:hypothetical protein
MPTTSSAGWSDAGELHCSDGDRDCSLEVIKTRPIRLLLNIVIMKFK